MIHIFQIFKIYTSDTTDEAYVASSSLPKYEINEEIIESSLPNGSDNNLEDLNVVKKTYSTIKFSSNVKFITGDRIVYTSDNPLGGLESGERYFVFVSASNKIRLYISRSLIGGSQFVELNQIRQHQFIDLHLKSTEQEFFLQIIFLENSH